MTEHVRYAGPLRWDVCAACHDPWPCAQVDRLIVELTPPCPSSRPFGPCTKQCEELAGHDGPHRSQCITWTDEEVAEAGHIKVIPGAAPVRIGDGPTISTKVTGFCTWNPNHDDPGEAAIVVDEVNTVYITRPFPEPVPIPGTPYEAYSYGGWYIGEFAIRVRAELFEPDTCPDGTACAFHEMRHVHPVPELPPLRVEPPTVRRGGIAFPVDPAIEDAFNTAKGQQP